PPAPPRSTLFPYTTLFRSEGELVDVEQVAPLPLLGRRRPDLHPGAVAEQLQRLGERHRARAHHEVEEVALGLAAEAVEEAAVLRSEEHTSELQSRENLVCR